MSDETLNETPVAWVCTQCAWRLHGVLVDQDALLAAIAQHEQARSHVIVKDAPEPVRSHRGRPRGQRNACLHTLRPLPESERPYRYECTQCHTRRLKLASGVVLPE